MTDRPPVRGSVVEAWLRSAAQRIHDARPWLTELDAAIGDADHGINLDRGFGLIVARLDAGDLVAPVTAAPPAERESGVTGPDADALATKWEAGGSMVLAAGRLILGTVGGASGALYGRALMRGGETLVAAPSAPSARSPLAREDDTRRSGVRPLVPPTDPIVEALAEATRAIAALGRSAPGQKTMLDALEPAVAAARSAIADGRSRHAALSAAADAADAGADSTVPMLALRGRASYLGPRSIGHRDPGASSAAILIRALADAVSGDSTV